MKLFVFPVFGFVPAARDFTDAHTRSSEQHHAVAFPDNYTPHGGRICRKCTLSRRHHATITDLCIRQILTARIGIKKLQTVLE